MRKKINISSPVILRKSSPTTRKVTASIIMNPEHLENILKNFKAKVSPSEFANAEVYVQDNGKESYISFYPPSRASYLYRAHPKKGWEYLGKDELALYSIPAYGFRLLGLRLGALYKFVHTRKNLKASLKEKGAALPVGWACKKIDELAQLTNKCLPVVQFILCQEGLLQDSIKLKIDTLHDEIAKATQYSSAYFQGTRSLAPEDARKALKALDSLCVAGSHLYQELRDTRL